MPYWVALGLMVVGIGIRVWSGPKYLDLFARRYSKAPPRGWLWTSDADAEVERWRRRVVLGSAVTLAGGLLLLFSAFR